jgi:hypothetical protein
MKIRCLFAMLMIAATAKAEIKNIDITIFGMD